MDKFEAGMLAKSKAGHDTGKIYVIADTDDAYVYLVDGKIRTLDKPKMKKKIYPWDTTKGNVKNVQTIKLIILYIT